MAQDGDHSHGAGGWLNPWGLHLHTMNKSGLHVHTNSKNGSHAH